MNPAPSPLAEIAAGGKVALARALARLEAAPESPETVALLDAAYAAPRAQVVGVTGPPGVGKSTLSGALIAHWRWTRRTVAAIAVDPSSRLTGGALLGDRLRLHTDPTDNGVFVRSMAARDRLGGLAALTLSAMVLMRALYDLVLIETVGVGQSETDVALAADTVVLCLQPGAGDSLQLMKAGIAEIPHVLAVTKADLGETADRTRADAAAVVVGGDWPPPLLLVSAARGTGIAELAEAIAAHWLWLGESERLHRARTAQAQQWLTAALYEAHGREGVRHFGLPLLAPGVSPFAALARAMAALRR